MSKRSIRNLELNGKRVFVRVDFNTPINNKSIGDDTRIKASLPTLRYALERGATVILASHLGRPKGKHRVELSLEPVAKHLSTLLRKSVRFAHDCIGKPAHDAIEQAHPGEVVMLENLRFHPEEERNEEGFSVALAELADIYINDAFSVAHRTHSSTVGIVRHLGEAGIGLLMSSELERLETMFKSPERPYVAVLGGAKISGKLEAIEHLLDYVDTLLIGGAMAYTFLKTKDLPIGQSLIETKLLDAAVHITNKAKARNVSLALPTDHVVADRLEAGSPHEILSVTNPDIDNRIGTDIGPVTAASYGSIIELAKKVIWNGPMGVFEIEEFAGGTMTIANAVAMCPGKTLIGGGDSLAAAHKAAIIDRITHISTGGGASLEFLGGRTLPGIAVLPNK